MHVLFWMLLVLLLKSLNECCGLAISKKDVFSGCSHQCLLLSPGSVWRRGRRHWFIRAWWTWTESKVARNSQEVCKVREKETKPTHEIIELMPCSNSKSLRKENILGPRREQATKIPTEPQRLWFVVSNCLRFVHSPCRISDTEQCYVMVFNERDGNTNNGRLIDNG